MRIIKLINAKPSLLQGEVNHYLKKVQNKYEHNVIIQSIKTLMVADGVEQACITMDYNDGNGITADMVLTI